MASGDKPKIRHDWYQTDSHVVVTILLKNAPADKLKIEYGTRTLSVSCPLGDGADYSLELDLRHEVVPEMCAHALSPSKIEVKLRKREGLRWGALEAERGAEADVTPIPQAIIDASGPAKPPPVFRKDWNKIESEIKKEEEQEKPEGEAALNALFQQIYASSSDEVRKAMNKSFVESGGTVLSTNWDQVKKDKVDVKPPEGVEYKKWDS